MINGQGCPEHHIEVNKLSGRLSAGMMLSVDEILEKAAYYERTVGVYFLISGNEIVYVGQSRNIMNRLEQHAPKIKFTRYAFAPFEEKHLDLVESLYIHLLRPRFNGLDTIAGVRRPAAPIALERLLDMALEAEKSLPQNDGSIGKILA